MSESVAEVSSEILTDTTNKNMNFFSALETASKGSQEVEKIKTTNSSEGFMSVADYRPEPPVEDEDEEVNNSANVTVRPKVKQENSCDDHVDKCEKIANFLNYLQDKGLITVNVEFSVCEEMETFHQGLEQGEILPVKQVTENEETFEDEIKEYADKALEIFKDIADFPTDEAICEYYKYDAGEFLNHEYDNLNLACTSALVPEQFSFEVQNMIMENLFPVQDDEFDYVDDTDMYYEDTDEYQLTEGDK